MEGIQRKQEFLKFIPVRSSCGRKNNSEQKIKQIFCTIFRTLCVHSNLKMVLFQWTMLQMKVWEFLFLGSFLPSSPYLPPPYWGPALSFPLPSPPHPAISTLSSRLNPDSVEDDQYWAVRNKCRFNWCPLPSRVFLAPGKELRFLPVQ